MPERQGSRLFPSGEKLATEAPVNGGRNYDGPKVNNEFSSTRALVKFGYMLETLSIRRYVGATMLRRDKLIGAGNQQERPPRVSGGILRDHTPDGPRYMPKWWIEEMVRAAWRHAEVGGNDRPSFQAARLTATR